MHFRSIIERTASCELFQEPFEYDGQCISTPTRHIEAILKSAVQGAGTVVQCRRCAADATAAVSALSETKRHICSSST